MEAENKRKQVANILKVTQSGEIILNTKTNRKDFLQKYLDANKKM